jgi:hypothetical protein
MCGRGCLHRMLVSRSFFLPSGARARHRHSCRISPEAYNSGHQAYKTRCSGLGEIALVAAIGLHALMGSGSS